MNNLPEGCTPPGWTPADIRYDEAVAAVEAEWRADNLAQCEGCTLREDMLCHKSERFPDDCDWFHDQVEERMQG